jgi:hypothetical protein
MFATWGSPVVDVSSLAARVGATPATAHIKARLTSTLSSVAAGMDLVCSQAFVLLLATFVPLLAEEDGAKQRVGRMSGATIDVGC